MAFQDSENLNYFLQWAREDIVEHILSLCLTGARYEDFEWTNVLSPTALKKYLFFFIDYDFTELLIMPFGYFVSNK
jgi:hypothetical protein